VTQTNNNYVVGISLIQIENHIVVIDECDDKLLRHKISNGEIHFAHIARYQGVIIEQYGIIGKQDTRKSYLMVIEPVEIMKTQLN
jgi:hypothetical protein